MLPINCQNRIVCAIHMVQEGPVAQMGPIGELNMETSSMVNKDICSHFKKFNRVIIHMELYFQLTKAIFRLTVFLRNAYE